MCLMKNSSDPDIYVDTSLYKKGENEAIRQESNSYYVNLINTPQSEVNQKIDDMIKVFRQHARAYAQMPMIQPTNNTLVDTTEYPDGVTLYIDATNLNMAQTGWKIKKLENQTLVFNILKPTVTISKEEVYVYKRENGNLVSIFKDSNGNDTFLNANTGGNGGDAGHNANVEKYILNHIVFNATQTQSA